MQHKVLGIEQVKLVFSGHNERRQNEMVTMETQMYQKCKSYTHTIGDLLMFCAFLSLTRKLMMLEGQLLLCQLLKLKASSLCVKLAPRSTNWRKPIGHT